MQTEKIGFLGGGNMARSLIGGLINGGFDRDKIIVSDPSEENLAELSVLFSVSTTPSNTALADQAQVIVMAVKPQIMPAAAREIASIVQARQPLLISIAAGVREPDICRWVGGNAAIVRTMPNTPALVQSGATALYANPQVTTEQRDQAESIMRAVGMTLWIEAESQLDAVTALSGSGPAYFFLIMELMEAAGVNMGLDEQTARLLTLETAFGAAKMALASKEEPSKLRERVTSPGGTTEAALKVFGQSGLADIVSRALLAAERRGNELGQKLGEN